MRYCGKKGLLVLFENWDTRCLTTRDLEGLILDEIALPIYTNSFFYEDTTMYLRDLQVVADPEMLYDTFREKHHKFHQKFNMHVCCIADNFLRRISGKIDTKSTAKIFLDLHTQDSQFKEQYDNRRGVYTISSHFDFVHYLTLRDEVEKKRMIAKHINNEFRLVFDKEGWDFSLAENAFEKMEEENYVFEGLAKRSWVNPSKKYRARMWFSYDLEEVKFVAVLYKNYSKKEICRRELTTLRPEYWFIPLFLENVRWASETILESRTADFAEKVSRVDFSDIMSCVLVHDH